MTDVFKNAFLPIFTATAWIGASEFFRNQFLLQSAWVEHYRSLGLVFPAAPVNGALWGAWSLAFALTIYVTTRRFARVEATLLSWWIGFVLMWLVIGNLGVLPLRILWVAVPMSLFEVFVAVLIVEQMERKRPAPARR